MELQDFIYQYKWELFICALLLTVLIIITVNQYVRSKLLDKYVEFDDEPKAVDDEPKKDPIDEFIKFNCDDCEHEPTNIKVGITYYSTEEGARARCEALYKRHNVNAEITFYFANQPPVKCFALDIWDFNK